MKLLQNEQSKANETFSLHSFAFYCIHMKKERFWNMLYKTWKKNCLIVDVFEKTGA